MKKTFLMWLSGYMILFTCMFVTSCSNEVEVPNTLEKLEASTNSHAISLAEALDNLENFMDETEGGTRGTVDTRNVGNVYAVKYPARMTRAASVNDCENLVYVANFENEEGFAVLAADDRIEEKVIAVTDNGSLSSYTINKTLKELTTNDTPLVKGYPLTGNGFLTVDEYPGEIFMNPNTVNLYDANEDDTLVGNFLLEDDDELLESEIGDTLTVSSPHKVVSALALSYAILDLDQNLVSGGGGSTGGNSPRTVTSTSSWSITKSVYPMLGAYKYWHQGSPFNDWYPQRRKFILFGKKKKAPAGCFPLALAKILTYHSYPTIFTFNGTTVNWNALKSSYSTTNGAKSAAALLRGISEGCESWYFYNGTFTFPKRAASFMRHAGFNNANLTDYSFSKVTSMLDQKCPLAICACPNINIFKSHAWNIDGYKVKTRTVTTKKYVGNTLKETTTKTETCNMVHCDFGWQGKCNGYFVSGVFKLNSSDAEIDNPYLGSNNTNYNNFIKIITYNKP